MEDGKREEDRGDIEVPVLKVGVLPRHRFVTTTSKWVIDDSGAIEEGGKRELATINILK